MARHGQVGRIVLGTGRDLALRARFYAPRLVEWSLERGAGGVGIAACVQVSFTAVASRAVRRCDGAAPVGANR